MTQYDQQIKIAINQLDELENNKVDSPIVEKQESLSAVKNSLLAIKKEEWLKSQELVDLIWQVIYQDMHKRFQNSTLPKFSEVGQGNIINNYNNLLEYCLASGLLPDRASSNKGIKLLCDKYVTERAQREFRVLSSVEEKGLARIRDTAEFYKRAQALAPTIVESEDVENAVLALQQPSNQVRDKILQLMLQENSPLLYQSSILESLTPEELKKLSLLLSEELLSEEIRLLYSYAYTNLRQRVYAYYADKLFNSGAIEADSVTLSMLDYLVGNFIDAKEDYNTRLSKVKRLAEHESVFSTTTDGYSAITHYTGLLSTTSKNDYPSLVKVNVNFQYEYIVPKTLNSLTLNELFKFLTKPSDCLLLEKEWNEVSQQQFDDLITIHFNKESETIHFNKESEPKLLFARLFVAAPMNYIINSTYTENFGNVLKNVDSDGYLQYTDQSIHGLYAQKIRDKTHQNTPINTAMFFAKYLNVKQLAQEKLVQSVIKEAQNFQDYERLLEIFFQADRGKRWLCIREFLTPGFTETQSQTVDKVFAVLAYFEKFREEALRDEEIGKKYSEAKDDAICSLVALFKSQHHANIARQLLIKKEGTALQNNELSSTGLKYIADIIAFGIEEQKYYLADDTYQALFSGEGLSFEIPRGTTDEHFLPLADDASDLAKAMLVLYREAIFLNISKNTEKYNKTKVEEIRASLSTVSGQGKVRDIMPVYKKVFDSIVTQMWELILKPASEDDKAMAKIQLVSLVWVHNPAIIRTKNISSMPSLVDKFVAKFYQENSNFSLLGRSQYANCCALIKDIIKSLQQRNFLDRDRDEIEKNAKTLKSLLDSLDILGDKKEVDIVSLVVEISLFNQEEILNSLDAVESQIKENEERCKEELITALDALEKYTNKKDIMRRTESHRTERLGHIRKMSKAAKQTNNEQGFNKLRDNPPKVEFMGTTFGTYHTYLPALNYNTWNYFQDDSDVLDVISKILDKQEEIKEKQKERDIAEVVIYLDTQLSKLEKQLQRQEENSTKISASEAGIEKKVLTLWESLLVLDASSSTASGFFSQEPRAGKLVATWKDHKGTIIGKTDSVERVEQLKGRSANLITQAKAAEIKVRDEEINQRKIKSARTYENILSYFKKVQRGEQKISVVDFEPRLKWFAELEKICLKDKDSRRLQEIEAHFKTMPKLGPSSKLAGHLKDLTPFVVHEDWSNKQLVALKTSAREALEELQEQECKVTRAKQEEAEQAKQRAETEAINQASKIISDLESALNRGQRSDEELAKVDLIELQRQIKQLACYFGVPISSTPATEGISPGDENANMASSRWPSVAAPATSWLSKSVVTKAMQAHRMAICGNEKMKAAVIGFQEKLEELSPAVISAQNTVAQAKADVQRGSSHLMTAQGPEGDALYEGRKRVFDL